MSIDNNISDEVITITASELKNLIKEAVQETKGMNSSFFNKGDYIKKRKHELHLRYEPTKRIVEKSISRYHPYPDQWYYASLSRITNGIHLGKAGPSQALHELAKKFALLTFGVATNRDLDYYQQDRAIDIYNQLIELFFINYELHLKEISEKVRR